MNTCDTYPASTSWMLHDFEAIAKAMSNSVKERTVHVEHHKVGVHRGSSVGLTGRHKRNPSQDDIFLLLAFVLTLLSSTNVRGYYALLFV
jgi:hypothetical protein